MSQMSIGPLYKTKRGIDGDIYALSAELLF